MESILEQFGIKPKNIDLYYQAFTHQTFANEKKYDSTYQRLEFVGDAVIDAEVSLYLFHTFPNLDEGQMTLLRAKCVNKEAFADLAKKLELGELLRVGKGAEALKTNEGILADLFESFCAAVYLDQGREIFLALLESTVFKRLDELSASELKDPKTILQELLQTESREAIKYISKQEKSKFISTVTHDNHKFGIGKGSSKKEAEQNAAKNALSKMKGDK